MASQVTGSNSGKELLRQVREGMMVEDYAGNEIGTVQDYYFGASANDDLAAGAPLRDTGDGEIVEDIADIFAGHELPNELQDRLLHDGFIQLDGEGLLMPVARYILPNQIAGITGNRIRLTVSRDELIK